MSETRIAKYSASKTIDYRDSLITSLWIKRNASSKSTLYSDDNACCCNTNSKINTIFSTLGKGDVIVCATATLDDSELITKLHTAAKTEVRSYLLCNEKPDMAVEKLAGSILVRYGVNLFGSFIIKNPASKTPEGFLVSGPLVSSNLNSDAGLCIKLDEKQCKDLFRFFCELFWNKANKEMLEPGHETDTSEPPLDFLTPIENYCEKEFLVNTWKKEIENSTVLIASNLFDTNFGVSENQTGTLVTYFKTDLTEIKNESVFTLDETSTIAWSVLLTDNKGILLPFTHYSDDADIFGIELNPQQLDSLNNICINLVDNCKIQFIPSITRGNLYKRESEFRHINEDSIWLEPDVLKESIEALSRIELNEWHSRESFESQSPSSFPDNEYNVEIEYNWDIIPFLGTKKMKPDPLYKKWEEAQEKYNRKIAAIKRLVSEIESTKQNLSAKIVGRLGRFFLGKSQKQKEVLAQLEKYIDVSLVELNKVDTNKYINEINQIIEGVNKLQGDVKDGIKREEFEIEREIKIAKLQKELEQAKSNKSKSDNELKELNVEFDRLNKDKQAALANFFCENKIADSDREKWLKKNKNILQWNKKQKKKKLDEYDDAQKNVNSYNNIIKPFDPKIKKLSIDKRDLESVLKNKETKIANINQNIIKVQKEEMKTSSENKSTLSEHLEKGKNKKQVNNSHIADLKEQDIPSEKPPKVGELYKDKAKRFLAISYWEDEELGIQEAERLDASLCALKG